MVAMAATIAVVYPHMNSLGGDGFWLIRLPSGKLRAIDASGPAGTMATIAHYQHQRLEAIPTRGPLSALTVPGAVGGWAFALLAARQLGGYIPLTTLLAPAIRCAREGYAVTRSQARPTV